MLTHVRHLAADVAGKVAHRSLSVRQPFDDAQALRVREGSGDRGGAITEGSALSVASIGAILSLLAQRRKYLGLNGRSVATRKVSRSVLRIAT